MPQGLITMLYVCLFLGCICLGGTAFAAITTERHLTAQRRSDNSQPQAQSLPNNSDATSHNSSTAQTIAWLGRRIYEDCQDTNDFIGCLKQKALHALVRALDQDSIKIVDGLVLEKQNNTEKESIIDALTDGRQFGSLAPIDRALLSKLDKLFRTHTLKMDMSVGRGEHEHKHKHKKKKDEGGHIKYVIAALLTAMGIAGPLGLKALAAIAGKALVISKVALTIAGIIALKKLFSHDHSEETSFHVGDHNRRSTYVMRPIKSPKTATSAGLGITSAAGGPSVEPYRYYYEYYQ